MQVYMPGARLEHVCRMKCEFAACMNFSWQKPQVAFEHFGPFVNQSETSAASEMELNQVERHCIVKHRRSVISISAECLV